jgi:anti-anti-sigma factor
MRSFHHGDTHVIRLAGELELTTVDTVEHELRRVELTWAHTIAIDLRRLTFIDSAGMRLLLQAAHRSSQGTNRLVLTRGTEAVQRVFEICDVAARLPFVDQLSPLAADTRPATTANTRADVTGATSRQTRRRHHPPRRPGRPRGRRQGTAHTSSQ